MLRHKSRKSGFTLVEITVALALVGIVMAMAAGFFLSVRSVYSNTGAATDTRRQLQAFKEEISAAFYSMDGLEFYFDTDGESQSTLRFYSREAEEPDDIVLLEFTAAAAESGGLVLTMQAAGEPLPSAVIMQYNKLLNAKFSSLSGGKLLAVTITHAQGEFKFALSRRTAPLTP